MRVTLTGAFGNIGSHTLEELIGRGHQVRCFDLPSRSNRRAARRWSGQIDTVWGDLRRIDHVEQAVEGQQVVVHLGFVIPHLSGTGVSSESDPAWSRAINVGGTRNLIRAMRDQALPPKLLFSSSLHIYGLTQHKAPPRRVDDPPAPVEHYAMHKVECEQLVSGSDLRWAIFRLGAALPIRLVLDRAMFRVGLDNRIEFVHAKDVALAIANALETDQVWGKTWLIGGGPRCQLRQRDLVEGVMQAVGIGMLPDSAFASEPYPTDWLDTGESQAVLRFQRRTLRDYLRDVVARLGAWRALIRLFRPLIRCWLLNQSAAQRRSA